MRESGALGGRVRGLRFPRPRGGRSHTLQVVQGALVGRGVFELAELLTPSNVALDSLDYGCQRCAEERMSERDPDPVGLEVVRLHVGVVLDLE